MADALDIFLRDRPLSDEERRMLRAALSVDSDSRLLLSRWNDLEQHVESTMDAMLPDRRLLVLYVMERAGIDLTEEEQSVVDAARPRLERASETIRSFGEIEERIQDDIHFFESCWASHRGTDKPRLDRKPEARDGRRVSRWLWRIPVAGVVLFFIAVVVLLGRRDGAFEHVATGPGETLLIEFADGTNVHLKENSTLSYVPQERQGLLNKRARLEGRAVFDVAPQQAGMLVETRSAILTVLGTMFALAAYDDVTDVYLIEGRVSVVSDRGPQDAVSLAAGEHTRVERGRSPSAPAMVDFADLLDWTGFFIFRSTPLSEIAARIGGHYGLEVDVEEGLQSETVTGTFEVTQSAVDILRTIAAAVDADVQERADGGFRIARR